MDAAREKAVRGRIAELKDELRQLRAQLAAQPKVYERVLELVKDGCNTSLDIAEEMHMPVRLAATHLRQLRVRGLVRQTGRVIKRPCGHHLLVWETV